MKEEINEYITWCKIQKQAFDSIITKLEEKDILSNKDLTFVEKTFRLFEEGEL